MIVVLMGVSGAGKTTVGRALAEAKGWEFVEGDDLHPQANIDKMRRGEPLDDNDRAPWLRRLRELIDDRLARHVDSVIACSALKQAYRDRLRADPDRVRFAYLHGEEALIRQRLVGRSDHFMPAELFDSQRQALQPPVDAIEVDAASPVAESVRAISDALERELED